MLLIQGSPPSPTGSVKPVASPAPVPDWTPCPHDLLLENIPQSGLSRLTPDTAFRVTGVTLFCRWCPRSSALAAVPPSGVCFPRIVPLLLALLRLCLCSSSRWKTCSLRICFLIRVDMTVTSHLQLLPLRPPSITGALSPASALPCSLIIIIVLWWFF